MCRLNLYFVGYCGNDSVEDVLHSTNAIIQYKVFQFFIKTTDELSVVVIMINCLYWLKHSRCFR